MGTVSPDHTEGDIDGPWASARDLLALIGSPVSSTAEAVVYAEYPPVY